MNAMEFQIEKNSLVPAIKQIQEQIKLSIAMGVLKRGRYSSADSRSGKADGR